MFSRDDSDRRPRVWLPWWCGSGSALCWMVMWAAISNGDTLIAIVFGVAPFVLSHLATTEEDRIRRRLSRPDEHETNYADRVG